MKNRKPSLYQQKLIAKELQKNEIQTKKICLEVALKKVRELKAELKSLMTGIEVPQKAIAKIRKELEEQDGIARSISEWLDAHKDCA